MSKKIINEEKYGLTVNTFWGGKKGLCVQFTSSGSEGYTSMTYKQAIKFLKEALKKLEDETNK